MATGPTEIVQNHYLDIPLDAEDESTPKVVPETQPMMSLEGAIPSNNQRHSLENPSSSIPGDFGNQDPSLAVKTSLPFAQQLSNGEQHHMEQFVVTQINNGYGPNYRPQPSPHPPILTSIRHPVYAPRRRNFMQKNCGLCIKLCKWFPVVFILSVLAWGYYAFNVQLCLFTMNSILGKIFLMIIFHFWFVMCLWSYYQTIFTDPGQPPREFWLTVDDIERLNAQQTEEERVAVYEAIVSSRRLPVQARTYSGGYRTCEKCNLIKPDRAHHCSVCDACILKMDHHCPWLVTFILILSTSPHLYFFFNRVNNCVSYTNYKFFVLFLGYSFGLCLYSAAVALPYFLKFWKNDLGNNFGKLHILFLFFVSIMFAVSLASLFFYHIFLTLKNRSTLESFRTPIFRYGPDKKAYDLGKGRNWREIFGNNIFFMFLPVTSR
jgi:palmitoyltransferase